MKQKNNYFTLLENSIEVLESKNKELYIKLIDKTKNELMDLYSNKAGAYGRTDYYNSAQYYHIILNLQKRLADIGVKQDALLTQEMKKIYLEIKKQVGLDIGVPMNANDLPLEPRLDTVWCRDGKTFSERIWRNNAEVQETLATGISNIIIRGSDAEEVVNELIPLCNQTGDRAISRANTLIRTELSFARAKATLDSYKAAGIEEYVFHNTVDDSECDECHKINGKTFKVADAVIGVNFPPIHPNCRGWTRAVIK